MMGTQYLLIWISFALPGAPPHPGYHPTVAIDRSTPYQTIDSCLEALRASTTPRDGVRVRVHGWEQDGADWKAY